MSKLFMWDFQCKKCKHVFEDLQKPEDKRAIPCPSCKAGRAKRVISGTRVDWKNMGVSNDFPTAAQKWEKAQRKKAKHDKQDGPNLWMY